MTKLDTHYDLVRPLTDGDATALRDVHSSYGIFRVRAAPDLQSVGVEYDASRLSEKDVEGVLIRFGIPIRRRWSV